MTEVWKKIPLFKHHYASNLGRIKREEFKTLAGNRFSPFMKTYKEKILKQSFRRNLGYRQCSILYKTYSVHRLIAMAFIDNQENKPCVNHKNGFPWCNKVNNLEWCTHSENETHSFNVLNKKPSRSLFKKEDIRNILFLLDVKLKQNIIAKIYKVSKSTINAIATKRHYKKYIEEIKNEQKYT